jgi:hypothetical protein
VLHDTFGPDRWAPPVRPPRLLVEDPHLAGTDAPLHPAAEITICGGPADEREECPLVMDGSCPLGGFDAVVTALDGPWARSVRAAWAETSVPVVEAGGLETTDPAQRLRHHVGAALQQLATMPEPRSDAPPLT